MLPHAFDMPEVDRACVSTGCVDLGIRIATRVIIELLKFVRCVHDAPREAKSRACDGSLSVAQ